MFDIFENSIEYVGTFVAVLSTVFAGINFYRNRVILKLDVVISDPFGLNLGNNIKVKICNPTNLNITVEAISFRPDEGKDFNGIINPSAVGGVKLPYQISGHSSACFFFTNKDEIIKSGKRVIVRLGDGKIFTEKINISVKNSGAPEAGKTDC